jgi:DNA-binding XRE family transcriptional regulator
MVVALQDIIDALPAVKRDAIDRRTEELVNEVESLRELRCLATQTQTELARTLNISQPAVSKIEKQTDMYLSTLRGYIEAMGGDLDLIVRLPGRAPIRLLSLDHVADTPGSTKSSPAPKDPYNPPTAP